MLQYVAVCYLCYSVLKPEYVAMCYSVGWCVAKTKRLDPSLAFASVAACGSVCKCVAVKTHLRHTLRLLMLQCVTACISVLR